MLELDEDRRISFDELLQLINQFKNRSRMESSYMSNSSNSNYSNYQRQPVNKSPLRRKPAQTYRNDVSPLRGGKFLEKGRTPERNGRTP